MRVVVWQNKGFGALKIKMVEGKNLVAADTNLTCKYSIVQLTAAATD